MLVFDAALIDAATVAPAPERGTRLRRTLQRLLDTWDRQRALLAWNSALPRPACCAHLPSRVWRRHSALLSLRAMESRGDRQ